MTLLPRRDLLLTAAAALVAPGLARAAEPSDWRWLNAPKNWSWKDGALTCAAEPGSDFWRKTVGGPVVHSGHFWFRSVTGDFTLTAALDGDYAVDADQTGLMVRVDDATWAKHGVEWLKGKPHMATVFTRDWSDGNAFELATGAKGAKGPVRVRLARKGQTLVCSHALGEGEWVVDRYGYLPMGEAVEAGVMAAAPLGKGFGARISGVEITAG